jgi:hypothetical protein
VVSFVQAGDEAGHWLAGVADRTVVRWHDGRRSAIDLPYSEVTVSGVTASGLVAGTGSAGSDRAFVADRHTHIELTSGAEATSSSGVNESGLVAGTVRHEDFTSTAVIWDIDQPNAPTIIEPSGATSSFSQGINARGVVAINAFVDGGLHAYVVRPDGHPRPLRSVTPRAETRVNVIAGQWAAGWEYHPDTGQVTVLRWNLADGRKAEAITTEAVIPTAISPTGVIGLASTTEEDPALVIGDEVVPLPRLYEDFAAQPTTIDRHMAAAGGALTADKTKPVTWTCDRR